MKHCVNPHHVHVGPSDNEVSEILVALDSRSRVLGIGRDYIPNFELWREAYRA